MKLKEQIFHVTDAENIPMDMSQQRDSSVILNGKDNEIKLEHVFRRFELDEEEGTIYGTSLLSYFTIKDGKLVDGEGNTVEFFTADKKPILVTAITRPDLTDDATIDFEYVKAFSELIGINKPDELFADLLSDEEKQIFASERQKREADVEAENKRKADADAEKKALADAELENKKLADAQTEKKLADEELKKQADAEARAKVDPDYFVDEAKYKKQQKFFNNMQSFKEYTEGNVHFFYGNKWSEYVEDPCVLVKRGDDWFEEVEMDMDNIIEDDKSVVLEFVDGDVRKKVTLDLATDTISVSEAEKE